MPQEKKIVAKLFFILFIILLCGVWETETQSIPQIQPSNSTLSARTSYILNYFSSKQIRTTTKFTVDFTQSNIAVTSGTIGCAIKLNDALVSSPICNCTVTANSKVCDMKPNQNQTFNTKVEIVFDGLTNPYFLSTEYLPVNIYFSPSISSQNYTVTVLNIFYQPMSIIVNNFSQSEYGVGSTPVSYTFNLSLYYVSKNFQMQIQIPNQVSYRSITSELSFYGTVQDIFMMQIQSLLIFNIQTPTVMNPNGFMLLKLKGFGNPQYIGNSSSFKVTFQETQAVANCANCKIAQIGSGLVVQSKTPGDISVVSFTSTNLYIASTTNISINLQLYAGIPSNGKVSIYLPPQITPVIPVTCSNVFGFIIFDGNQPYCTYNSSQNRIDTQNFAFPFLVSIGNGIISLNLNNPSDSRSVKFHFQTFDNLGRTIGQSRQQYYYSSIPLIMSVTSTKNNSQVDSAFTLTTQIVLQRQINSNTNTIQVILPGSVNYNITAINCISALQNLNCNATYNQLGQLIILIKPPCVQCAVNNMIRFSIFNLKNPSYISEETEVIYIHTRSTSGIIEASNTNIGLKAAPINLIQYKAPLGQVVGSSYNLTVTLVMPEYVVSNGGQIHILFDQNIAYCNVLINQSNGNSVDLISQLSIKSGTINIPNQVLYYSNDSPSSVSRIIMDICGPSTLTCISGQQVTLSVIGLRKGYIPSLSNSQIVKITTKLGNLIAEKSVDMTSSSPLIKNSAALRVSMNPDMTNTQTQYQILFTSSQIVFSNQIQFEFSPDQNISGNCQFSSDYSISINYVCAKTAVNKIKITHDLNPSYMINNNIIYNIVVSSVSAPSSTKPRTYQLSTKFKDSKNQIFQGIVSIKNPFPLTTTLTQSNSTIGQQCLLSISIAPKTMNYNSFSLFILKSVFLVTANNAQQSLYIFSENQTHYQLKQSSKMVDNKTQLLVTNALSTITSGDILLATYDDQNYLIQTKAITIQYRQPIILGLQIQLTNRTVGQSTQLTLTVDRNNQGSYGEDILQITLPTQGFGYQNAQYESSQINSTNPVIRVPINITTPRVMILIIKNLTNMLFMPTASSNSISSISVTTKNLLQTTPVTQEILGKSQITPEKFIPTSPLSTISTAARTNTKSGQTTNITVNYSTQFGKNGDIMVIQLAQGQNSYASSSGCYIGSQQCSIVSTNLTTISLLYQAGKTITLVNVLNYHPNLNKMSIKLLTNSSALIESSSAQVKPPIALQFLHIQSYASTAIVGANNNLQFSITSTQLAIQPTQFMVITFPEKTFTRKTVSTDCQIIVNGNIYSGCQYNYMVELGVQTMWINSVKISSLGPMNINPLTMFKIKLYVTNPWASYPFSTKSIKFTVYRNQTTALSQGIEPLAQIYSTLSSFTPQQVQGQQILQSSQIADANNNITIRLNFNGNILINSTQIIVMVPKDTYDNITEIGKQTASYTTFFKQDTMYYYTKSNISSALCVLQQSAQVCAGYRYNITLTMKNDKFIKISDRNNIMAYAVYDGYPVTQFYSQLPSIYQPLVPPLLSVNRSNDQALQNSQVQITMNLQGNHSAIKLSISDSILNVINSVTCVQQLYSASGNTTNNLNCPQNKLNRNITISIASGYNGLNTMSYSIAGINTFQIPRQGIKFNITVQNMTHLLYRQYDIKFAKQLVPIQTGLYLQRANTVVGQQTGLTLVGALPHAVTGSDLTNYAISVNNVKYTNYAITTNSISLILQTYTNPTTLTSLQQIPCQIGNSTHIIYRNTTLVVKPQLVAIQANLNNVTVNMPATVFVNSQFNITIVFSTTSQQAQFYDIKVPMFFKQVVSVYGYQQNNLVSLTANTTTSIENSQNFVTIRISKNQQYLMFSANKIIIKVKSIDYQQYFTAENSSFLLSWQSPSTEFATPFNIIVLGTTLDAKVIAGSLRTHNTTYYRINVTSIAKSGEISVSLPPLISQQLVSTNSDPSKLLASLGNRISLIINNSPVASISSVVSVTSISPLSLRISLPQQASANNISLLLTSIINPSNSKPIQFTITQHEISHPENIYGYRMIQMSMQQFDEIHVYLAHRNTTKINQYIELNINAFINSTNTSLQTPAPLDMTIQLPLSQVILDSENCSIYVDGIARDCQMLADNRIKLLGQNGNHTYTVRNLKNAQYAVQPQQTEKVHIQIGQQYKTAQTTQFSTVFITPMVVTGSIQLLGVTATNSKRSQYSTLTVTIMPQNWQDCNGIVINFYQYAYYIHNNIQCWINGVAAQHMMINRSSIFIRTVHNSAKLVIQIANIINYLQNGPYNIHSVKYKGLETSARLLQTVLYSAEEYGVLDSLQVDRPALVFSAATPKTRIIFPNNYLTPASSQKRTIIAITDTTLPPQLPTSSLSFSFGSQYLNCPNSGISYNQTITIQCTVNKQGNADFYVRLYDSAMNSVALTEYSTNIVIYGEAHQQCSDVTCDLCAPDSTNNNNQVCLQCRQGLIVESGQCVDSCSQPGYFDYQGTCTQCAPSCSQCYDLYYNSCLQCQQQEQVLDSGICTQSCDSIGSFEYMGYCVHQKQCQHTDADGCRICSQTGFCYECLPNYDGQPTCSPQQIFPSAFFVFFLIPLPIILIVVTVVSCYKNGFDTYPNLLIYMLAVIQFFAWVFTVPRMLQQILAMILLSLILLRIINSIISYELYYSKIITGKKESRLLQGHEQANTINNGNSRPNQQRQSASDPQTQHPDRKQQQANKRISKVQQISQGSANNSSEITCKQRLSRFSGHFLSSDSYQLLLCKISNPYLNISHHPVFQILNIINRIAIMILLVYTITTANYIVDLLVLPSIGIVTGTLILAIRLVRSGCCGKIMDKIRGNQ